MANAVGRVRSWTWIHFATLAVVLVTLGVVCRGQWFFGDEWDFLLYRGLHHPRWGLWRPHNEHWSTLPILWYRAVFSTFGLKAYWPYMLGLFTVHLVAVHAAWRLMRRARVAAPLATGLAVVFAVFGAGAENLTWAFQIGFVASLAAGMVLLLALDGTGAPRRVAAVTAGACASLLLSGISVVMVGVVGLAALAKWGWRKAFVVAGVPAALYLLWLRGPGDVGLHTSSSAYHGGLSDLPRFVWGGLSSTLGAPVTNDRVGEALLIVVLVVTALHARTWFVRAPEVLALAAGAAIMFAVVSQGRGASADPAASRYLYLAAGMLLPLLGLALQLLVVRRASVVAALLVGCVALSAVGVRQLSDAAALERTRERTLKGQLLASLVIARDEPTLSSHPDFAYHREMRVASLVGLQAHGRVPSHRPTPADLAQARLALQVDVSHAGAVRRASAEARAPAGAAVNRQGACAEVDLRGTNALIIRSGEQAAFSVTAHSAGVALLFVPYASGNAGPRRVQLRAERPTTVRSVLVDPLVLQLPPGTHTVCGLRWTTP